MECLQEKQHHKKWLDLLENWKQLLYRNALASFVEFMESPEVTAPSEMTRLKEHLSAQQREAGFKRKTLMEHILSVRPPTASTTVVYEWRKDADKLYEDLGIIY